MTKYFTCAETAKLIRQSLKEAFPGVKFSVRSSTYSGGASISVSWTDGPNAAQVESITKGFKAVYFDSSIDYRGSIHHMMDGEHVQFGADYITSTPPLFGRCGRARHCKREPSLRRQLQKRRNHRSHRSTVPFRRAVPHPIA